MTVFEMMRIKRIPEYYDTMYRDGYKPYEIVEAAHNKIMRHHEEMLAAKEEEFPANVNFNVEVHSK